MFVLVGTSHTALTQADINEINDANAYSDLSSTVTDKVTNAWSIGDNTITTEKGAVNLTVQGSNNTYTEGAP